MRKIKLEDRREELIDRLSERSMEYVQEVLYHPLYGYLTPVELEEYEATGALEKALLSGEVTYEGGVFKGPRRAALSKAFRTLGGELVSTGGWRVAVLPPALLQLVQILDKAVKEAQFRMLEHLKVAREGTLEGVKYRATDAERSEEREELLGLLLGLDEDFEAVPRIDPSGYVKSYSDNIESGMASILTKRYEVLDDKIRSFKGSLGKLREVVDQDVLRAETACRYVAGNVVTGTVAQAMKDMSVAKGMNYYRWQTCEDERVRPSHAAMNGKVCSWSEPPLVGAYGLACHPGQDINCRCWAVPLELLKGERIETAEMVEAAESTR